MYPDGLFEIERFNYIPLKAYGLTDMGAALSAFDRRLTRKEFLLSDSGV